MAKEAGSADAKKQVVNRILVVLAAWLALVAVPAGARPQDPKSNSPGSPYLGSVELPAITPGVARLNFRLTGQNDRRFGDVFRLPSSADDATYTLRITSGGTGVEDPDVYFYVDGTDAPGSTQCGSVDVHEPAMDSETGTICPGPQAPIWAIVVLKSGAKATFEFAW